MNDCIHPVASGDIDLRKRPIRDSGGILCSSASYTDWLDLSAKIGFIRVKQASKIATQGNRNRSVRRE